MTGWISQHGSSVRNLTSNPVMSVSLSTVTSYCSGRPDRDREAGTVPQIPTTEGKKWCPILKARWLEWVSSLLPELDVQVLIMTQDCDFSERAVIYVTKHSANLQIINTVTLHLRHQSYMTRTQHLSARRKVNERTSDWSRTKCIYEPQLTDPYSLSDAIKVSEQTSLPF